MVVPPFSTLFAQPVWYEPGDVRPMMGAISLDNADEEIVFLLSPRTLGKE